MADFPALPLFTDAYIADTQHLTNEEHGVYLRLLMFAWRSPGCVLPDNDKRLAIMVGVTPTVWKRLKPVVMDFWTLENGCWTQKRLKFQRKYVESITEKKRAAGKASAKAKSLKNNNQASTPAATEYATERQQPASIQIQNQKVEEREDKSSQKKSGNPTAKRGTRLPADWTPSDADFEFAQSQGISNARIIEIADSFRDYWTAKTGKDATKLDWPATWRNWIRRERPDRGNARTGGTGSGYLEGARRAGIAAENRTRQRGGGG